MLLKLKLVIFSCLPRIILKIKKRLNSIDIFFKNKKINCINGKKIKDEELLLAEYYFIRLSKKPLHQ